MALLKLSNHYDPASWYYVTEDTGIVCLSLAGLITEYEIVGENKTELAEVNQTKPEGWVITGSNTDNPYLQEHPEINAEYMLLDNPKHETVRIKSLAEVADAVFYPARSDGVNVRTEPRHNSGLVTSINNRNTALYYFGESEQGYGSDGAIHTWYRIETENGLSGWVRSDLVRA